MKATLLESAMVSLILLLSAVGIGLLPVDARAAQEGTLTVTILIVDEKQACRPDGYASYADEVAETGRCKVLTVTDVQTWIDEDVLSEKIEIPPLRIPIGRLLPFLGSYIEINPGSVLDPEMRKSVVFLFDWNAPQEFDLSFRRVSSAREIPSSENPATFQMRGHRRWIHHERADALLPAYGVEWILATGGEELRLRMSGGQNGS